MRALVITLVALAFPAGAVAHVQVTPSSAAPGDAVLFEVLVPNERDESTTKVELKIPKDVIPFSFEDQPGWKRTVKEAADGGIDTVTWTGRLASDGFARFGFLASTPEADGTLEWKALQTYSDGEVSRWIGGPDSEEPAATTVVAKAVAKQNAGGETAAATAVNPAAGAAVPASDEDDDEDEGSDSDPVALGVGGAGLLLGAAALLVALRARRR